MRSHPRQVRSANSNHRTLLARFARTGCLGIALASIVGGHPAKAQSSREGTRDAVHWSRNEFVIPFQIDPSGEVPSEVRLEVSEDQGRTWKLHTRADVRTRQFRYRADRDGEFQFRLKTVDRHGNVFDNPEAPLIVIVDTAKPTGELLVDIDPKGIMQAECRIADNSLDPQSIAFEYQTDVHPQWTTIACEVRPADQSGQWVAFGTWNMPANASQLVVRVTARDLAGNSSEWTRMPRLPRSAGIGREMLLASNPERSEDSKPIGAGILRLPPPPQVSQAPSEPASSRPADFPKVEVLSGPGTHRSRPERSADDKLRDQMLESQQRLIEYQNRFLMQQRATAKPLDVGTVPDSVSPDPEVPSIPDSELAKPTALATQDVLHSNSRQFQLDYSIDNDPGLSVANIELWGTIDRGDSWEKWGTDADRRSPCDIEVAGDGLFGFRIVIVGANGVASKRPLPGDEADAWVRVDTQIPGCRIVRVLNGKGSDAGSLVIEYSATDDYFGDRPIGFSWAPDPKGPWQPISQGARNNGRYVWIPDPGLPERVFLRMEAIDAAGNVGASQLDLPVDVSGASPRGRIQGVRPQR